MDDVKLGILLYTDDIILLAECDRQNMLNVLAHKWRLAVNQSRTQMMHFRKKSTEVRSTQIHSGSVVLEYEYKYLSSSLQFMTYNVGTGSYVDTAGRAENLTVHVSFSY